MRPILTFLTESLIQQILGEARDLLCEIGVDVFHKDVAHRLCDHGAQKDPESGKFLFKQDLIDTALKTVPAGFKLYDVTGEETHHLKGHNVYFTPGSSSLNILDPETQYARRPSTADYVRYVKVVSGLKHIASQSTAFVPDDVDESIADSYRLYLNLLFGTKPVVTGTFNADGLEVMREMQTAIRGDEKTLKEKPLTIFSCCATTPLKWSERICTDIIECGKYGIPVELISMPLAGFTGPVTLVGSLIGHTAELLSGIVISQIINPGAPILYGGAPSPFDVRYETTPLGAVETGMLDCAYNEIGKYLNIPTQGYVGLSDAKALDAQAGLETGMGATMAALSGVNSISGAGMLDFVNCFSIEKLVVDNEICGMVYRMLQGVEPREDFPSVPRYRELLKDQHLLISKHSRRNLRKEHYFPSTVIDRAGQTRWREEGALNLDKRAKNEIATLLNNYTPSPLPTDIQNQLKHIMKKHAAAKGIDTLPTV